MKNEEEDILSGMVPIVGMLIILPFLSALQVTKATLSGKVMSGGAPVADAVVGVDGKTTTTDNTGAYGFTDITPGTYTLSVSQTGYGAYTAQISLVKGSNVHNVELTPIPTPPPGKSSLYGLVKLATTSQPLQGITVKLDSLTTNTDTSGGYYFTDVLPGQYSISFTDAGVEPLQQSITLVEGVKILNVLLTPVGIAAFTVSDLVISPTEPNVGQPVTISVLVTNTGSVTGDYTVTLKINDVVVDTKTVTLGGGVKQTVTFTVSKDTAGTYTVGVDGLSGTFTAYGVPPPVNTVTFDRLRFKCNWAPIPTYSSVEAELTITNNLPYAYPGQYIVVFASLPPAGETVIGTVFFKDVGGISPGTHVYTAEMWDKKEVFPGGTISLKLSLVQEGQAGIAVLMVLTGDLLPTAIIDCYGGIFSSAWAEWARIPFWFPWPP
jgi:hypothetical protein